MSARGQNRLESLVNMIGIRGPVNDGTCEQEGEGSEVTASEPPQAEEQRCPECNDAPYDPLAMCRMCGLEPAGDEVCVEDQGGIVATQGARRRGPSPYGPAFDSTIPLNRLDQFARNGVPKHLARDVYECAVRLFGRARADRLFANGFLDLFIRPLVSHPVAAELNARLRGKNASMPKDPVSSFSRSRRNGRRLNGLSQERKVIALTLALALMEDELLAIEQQGTSLQGLLRNSGLAMEHVIEAKKRMNKVLMALVKVELVDTARFTGRGSQQDVEEDRCMMMAHTLVEQLAEPRFHASLKAQIKERVEAMLADDAHPQYCNRTPRRRWALATWAAFGAIGYLDGNETVIATMFGMSAESLKNSMRTMRASDPKGRALDADQLRIHARVDRQQNGPTYPALEERGFPENILRMLRDHAASLGEQDDELHDAER
jgi:hypothetical protein